MVYQMTKPYVPDAWLIDAMEEFRRRSTRDERPRLSIDAPSYGEITLDEQHEEADDDGTVFIPLR